MNYVTQRHSSLAGIHNKTHLQNNFNFHYKTITGHHMNVTVLRILLSSASHYTENYCLVYGIMWLLLFDQFV